MLAASMGFVLTLNIINVDGLIVRQNLQRVLNGGGLVVSEGNTRGGEDDPDAYYLQSLSTDAVPTLVKAQQNSQLDEEVRNELAAILACQISIMLDEPETAWQSFHWADYRALRLLKTHQDVFSAARVYENETGAWWVKVNDEERPCRYNPYEYY